MDKDNQAATIGVTVTGAGAGSSSKASFQRFCCEVTFNSIVIPP